MKQKVVDYIVIIFVIVAVDVMSWGLKKFKETLKLSLSFLLNNSEAAFWMLTKNIFFPQKQFCFAAYTQMQKSSTSEFSMKQKVKRSDSFAKF